MSSINLTKNLSSSWISMYYVDTFKNILTYHLHIFHVWGTTRGIRLQEAFHLEVMLTAIYLTFMQIHERAQQKMICVTTTKLSNYLSNYLTPTWHVGQFFCRNLINPSHTLSSWETLKTSNFWLFIFRASVEVSVVVTVVSSVQRPAHFLVLDKISKIDTKYFMSQKYNSRQNHPVCT